MDSSVVVDIGEGTENGIADPGTSLWTLENAINDGTILTQRYIALHVLHLGDAPTIKKEMSLVQWNTESFLLLLYLVPPGKEELKLSIAPCIDILLFDLLLQSSNLPSESLLLNGTSSTDQDAVTHIGDHVQSYKAVLEAFVQESTLVNRVEDYLFLQYLVQVIDLVKDVLCLKGTSFIIPSLEAPHISGVDVERVFEELLSS